ncbi:FimV/HubP family polar landmark protein [Pseudomonas sp. LFM046]|uniref:FimV/HubP family polar landmark protein n=1 Tax=Pseudomonas sp. LFM046 TaxID=1608357 RepID=UPI00069879CA|nr:FimV/HubP family polar landmark protein [Pseudomonas sp. LFM046]
MARVHKLLLTLASGSALYSGLVPALGLGEITLHSALNQPLDAEIELLEVGDLNDSEIKVSLASADAFQRAGVDRYIFLNDLRFSPVIRGSSSRIRVVSSKPVVEPYLNFIVEVARPNGRLLREYTLLLDPPGSAAYAASAAPVSSMPALPVAARPQAPVSPKAAPAATQGKRYQVVRGDSLWAIAKRLSAGSGMTQKQMADGIHALNTQAFPGGDINRLHVGQSLLLPDDAVLASAPAPVAETVEAVAPVAAPVESPVAATPAGPSLAELNQVQQSVDSRLAQSEAERAQLRQDIAALEAQLETMQEQLKGSDQQMAALQAQVQQAATAPVSEPEKTQPAPVVVPAVQAAERVAPVTEGNSGISPVWWVVMVSGLFLLFLLDWVLLRRSRREAQQQELEEAQTTGKAKVSLHRHHDVQPQAPAMPAPAPVAVKVAVPLQLVTTPSAKASPDALEGANIYIAYGRWREAEAVLTPAVAKEPQRVDLRFRLLEVLGELRDPVAFTLEAAALRDLHADEARLAAICARFVDVGSAQALAEPEFVLDDVAPALVEASEQPQDSLAADFDGYPLDANWDQVSPFKIAEPKRKAAAAQALPTVEEDLAFPTNLQELPEVFELTLDADMLSPFGELPELSQAEALDELTDEFADPMVSLEELDKLDARQENIIKLNLALAYIEQGNIEAACSILNEVISEGDDEQKQEARDLLAKIA